MMEYESNIAIIVGEKLAQLKELGNNGDPILRQVAMALLPEIKHRVHTQGLDAAGGQIGNYSPSYMVLRTGDYKNAATFKKGKDKGKKKDSGKYTDKVIHLHKSGVFMGEDKVGTARPKYNRTPDTKVILSLTRQMENDFEITGAIDTPGGYGLGYSNPHNYQKALWCEATYKKPILSKLTNGEIEMVQVVAEEFTTAFLK